ncbi:MAG: acyltransferase [Prevotellaceae bacterium]|nr:acyltransferase [Candidatus Faecinaster equi]
MSENRLKYLDLASGIMIVWLLLYHALYPMVGDNISGKIPFLYFFMPWFFYKSGMMFHLSNSKKLLKKDYSKLIRTFIIWSIIGYVVYLLWHGCKLHDLSLRIALYCPIRSLALGGSIPLNSALWFLPVLFLVRQIANYGISKIHPLWMVLFSLIATAIMLTIKSRFFPFWLSSTCWGLFFFCVGYYLKDKENKWWVTLVALILCAGSYFTAIPSVYSDNSPQWHNFMLWLPACVCACITFNNVCRWLERSIDNVCHGKWFFPIFSYVGRNSMTYYVGHYLIFKLGFDIIATHKAEWYASWQGLCIVIGCYAVILTSISIFLTRQNR